MAIYLFNVKTFVFFLSLILLIGNFSESRKSKVEPEIDYDYSAEESWWLRSYVNHPEGNCESSEHTTDDTD
jgi:hypothetical protein